MRINSIRARKRATECAVYTFCYHHWCCFAKWRKNQRNEIKSNEKVKEEQSSGQKDTFDLIENDKITAAVVDDLTLYLCVVLHIIRACTIYLILFVAYGLSRAHLNWLASWMATYFWLILLAILMLQCCTRAFTFSRFVRSVGPSVHRAGLNHIPKEMDAM